MIREFSVKPKPSNNNARLIFVFGASLAFAFILLSTFIPLYKGVVSLVGVALLSLALVVYAKYIAPIYYYDITFDSQGRGLFVVRQQVGKRQTTLCRISLHEIVGVEKQTAEQRRAHKTPVGVIKYSYLPTLFPSDVYMITNCSRYEKAEILIEVSDDFAEIIRSYSCEARDMNVDEEGY